MTYFHGVTSLRCDAKQSLQTDYPLLKNELKMGADEFSIVANRLKRLERTNRFLLVSVGTVGLALFLVVALGMAKQKSTELVGQSLELKDAEGRVRCSISADDEGVTQIFFDKQQRRRFEQSVLSDGTTAIYFVDEHGDDRIQLRSFDQNHKLGKRDLADFAILASARNSPHSRQRVRIRSEESTSKLSIHGKLEEKVEYAGGGYMTGRAQLEVHHNGYGDRSALNLSDNVKQGAVDGGRIVLSSGSRNEDYPEHIIMRDKNLKVTFNATQKNNSASGSTRPNSQQEAKKLMTAIVSIERDITGLVEKIADYDRQVDEYNDKLKEYYRASDKRDTFGKQIIGGAAAGYILNQKDEVETSRTNATTKLRGKRNQLSVLKTQLLGLER